MSTVSLAAVLVEPARRVPDKTAVIEGESRFTYDQLWSRARRFAQHLLDLGVEPGQRVALLCTNTVEFPVVYYGILAAGSVVVPVPTLLNVDEIEYLITDSGAQLLVCHDTQRAAADEVAARTGIPVVTATASAEGPLIRNYVSRSADDVAVLFYTSGTTGRPKGALLTHLNLLMCATVNAFDANPFRCDDTVLGCCRSFTPSARPSR